MIKNQLTGENKWYGTTTPVVYTKHMIQHDTKMDVLGNQSVLFDPLQLPPSNCKTTNVS